MEIREITEKCMDLTAELARTVIETALSEKFGKSWMTAYRKDYNEQIKLKNNLSMQMSYKVKAIDDFDFQALMKLFRYMDRYASVVIEKYNLNCNKDTILELADKLIIFRNTFFHNNESKKVNEYVCEQAIINMKTFVAFFPNVKEKETNETYKSKIEKVYLEYSKTQNAKWNYFSKHKEFDGIPEEKLLIACTKLSIDHDYDLDKNLMFCSCDVENDIKRIVLSIDDKNGSPQQYQAKKKNTHKIIATITIILIITVSLAIIVAVSNSSKSSNEIDNASQSESNIAAVNGYSEHQSNYSDSTTESATANNTTTAEIHTTAKLDETVQAAIDDFVPDSLNTKTLKVGQTDKPGAALWLQGNTDSTRAVSSNENVVTVSPGGKVTAVGKGSAYVVIKAPHSSMYDIMLYNVQ